MLSRKIKTASKFKQNKKKESYNCRNSKQFAPFKNAKKTKKRRPLKKTKKVFPEKSKKIRTKALKHQIKKLDQINYKWNSFLFLSLQRIPRKKAKPFSRFW